MNSIRLIGNVLVKENIAVQSINFKKYLPIGSPKILIEYLNKWGIDEIIILNIKGSIIKDNYLKKNLKIITQNCNTPVSAGGGIKSLKDVESLIRGGADKVVINSYGILNKELIKKSALEFGNQAIIASIDIKRVNNKFEAYIKSGTEKSKYSILDTIKFYEDNQAGELFINSIDNDGKKNGFDVELFGQIQSLSSLPTIICGGAGNFNQFINIIKLNPSGISSGNFLNFTEHSVKNLKYYLNIKKNYNQIRFQRDVKEKNFDFMFRSTKLDDKKLEELKYRKIEKIEI